MLLTSLRRTIARPVFTSNPAATTLRNFSITANRMGVTKTTISEGNGTDFPKPKDTVSMHYEGFIYENGQKTNEFDSSRKRGSPFVTQIGIGRVIRGWDEGVPQMSLGEKATLLITPDYGYGDRGFPGAIPPKSTLLFEVELLGINDKKV